MTKQEIRIQVAETGCASVGVEDLRRLWPSWGQASWDVRSASDWCEANRLQMEVDPIISRVYFNPKGIYAPAVS